MHQARWQPPPPPAIAPGGVDPAVAAAVAQYRAAVVRTPRSGAAWGKLGLVLVAHHIDPEARFCFVQAERLDPRNPRWPYLQAMVLNLEDSEEALRKLQRTVLLCADDFDAPRLRLGELLLGLGRYEAARDQFEEIASRGPGNSRAHLGLARVEFQCDRLNDAAQDVAEALRDRRTRKAAHQLLAEIEHRRQRPEAAADALKEAAALPEDQSWPDPYLEEIERFRTGRDAGLERAQQLLRQENAAEAAALLQTIVGDYPEDYRPWMLLSLALGDLGRVTAAEEAARTAVRLQDDSGDAHHFLGAVLFVQEKWGAASASFQRAAQLRPNSAEAHYMLGRCLLETGDRSRAVEAFRSALRCRPEFPDALAALADVLVREGGAAEVVAPLRRAVELNPLDHRIRRLLEQAEAEVRRSAP
jgi:tetratricopeptide (TPR) repeat protein